MTPEQLPFLTLAILLVAFLYSCVGHAGASGYIAVMTLFSLSPEAIKDIEAVIINIDRKSRSINLSVKQKDAAEESAAMQKHAAESNASSGTTNLGALLKAKLGGSKDKE